MRKILGLSLPWLGLILMTPAARADGLLRRGCADGCRQCEPTYTEKLVTCYRPEWHDREVKCTVNRVIPHDVVSHEKCTVMVPTWHDEKRMMTVCRYVPHQAEREIVKCKKVRVCNPPCDDCCDRCCRRPRYHREWVEQVCKVPCKVWEAIQETKEVTMKVCRYVPQEKSYDVHRTVCEVKPETIVRKEHYCVMVPYQVKVKVPSCCP